MNRALLATVATVAFAVALECGGGGVNNCDRSDDKNAGVVWSREPPSNGLSDEYTLHVRRLDSTNVVVPTDKFGFDHCPIGAHWPACRCR